MELWSLKLVEGRVNYRNSSIPLKPSTDGLKHNIPPKTQLFSLKRRTFFPEPEEVLEIDPAIVATVWTILSLANPAMVVHEVGTELIRLVVNWVQTPSDYQVTIPNST